MALQRAGRRFIERFWEGITNDGDRHGHLSVRRTEEHVTLYSYHAPIARYWPGYDYAWVSDQRFSVTTTNHQTNAVVTSRSLKLKRSKAVPETYNDMFAIAAVEQDTALEREL